MTSLRHRPTIAWQRLRCTQRAVSPAHDIARQVKTGLGGGLHCDNTSSIMSVSAVSVVSTRQQARGKRNADCTCTVCRPSYNPYGIVICSDVLCPCGANSGNTMGLSFDSSIPRSRSWRLLTCLLVMAALRSRCGHYIFALFLLSFFLGFFLA